ncbi:MAG: hypothetical protein HQK53_07240 [Oligoflexia bacterium]|nr:hypothetical protein [Oligoflexia bacterium]
MRALIDKGILLHRFISQSFELVNKDLISFSILMASILTIMAIPSCSNKDNDSRVESTVKNVVAYPSLVERKWENDCQEAGIVGLSSKDLYEFKGSSFDRVVSLYEDRECKNLGGTITYHGSFQVNSNQLNDKSRDIKFTYNKVLVRPNTEKIVSALMAMKLCGHEDWVVGKEVDVTSNSASIVCPVSKTPNVKYNIVLIEDNVLFFGKDEVDTEAARDTSVERNEPFHKI